MIDPHKYDYLHAEGPNEGDFEGWQPQRGCICDACFFTLHIENWDTPACQQDYLKMKQIMADHPELDRIDAFTILVG